MDTINMMQVSYNANKDSIDIPNVSELKTTDNSLGMRNADMSYHIGDYDWYYNWYYPYYIREYPIYRYITEEDKYKKAFGIAKMLLKQKILVSNKLVDFIKLVEDITALL